MLVVSGPAVQADTIDFEGLPAGTIVDELSKGAGIDGNATGVVKVQGRNTIFPNTNAAIIFDSDCPVVIDPVFSDCGRDDLDIGSPNEDFGGPGVGEGGEAGSPFQNDEALGMIMVLAKDLVDTNGDNLVDDPDDADVPGFIDFDFSMIKKGQNDGTVTINSVQFLDIEFDEGESPAQMVLMGPNIPTATISIIDTGNNGLATIEGIKLEGVSNVRVEFLGSGSLGAISFDEPKGEKFCWITTGGFQNAGVQAGSKDYTFGGNVGPPAHGSWEVIDHETGDNFHTHDVRITNCITIEGTGPGQPGGKKGFDVNQAFFECTSGTFNHVDGYTCTGYVIDRGEPSGKNGNDTDEYAITVRDGNGVVVMEVNGMLDGGNVQIHPPVKKTLNQ
ncbi:MAG: hypothetical protein KJO76_08770 [Gammaproteobacteria bacterium]|nr:hypothetical protein [Gammaproteobacteria bacterium]